MKNFPTQLLAAIVFMFTVGAAIYEYDQIQDRAATIEAAKILGKSGSSFADPFKGPAQ